MSIIFTPVLRGEYRRLLMTLHVRPEWADRINRRAAQLLRYKSRYQEIGEVAGVPWEMIAAIHNLESGADFHTHLHNGDPLTARTHHEPKGRPDFGEPPYTWEESAEDAFKIKGFPNAAIDWTDERICYEMERYNGFGQRLYHTSVLSPYLWSGTYHYERGKYVEDGKWDGSAVSQQIGGIPLIMAIRNLDTATKKDLAPVSEKLDLIHKVKTGIAWVSSAVGGYMTLDNFDLASNWFGRIKGAAPLLLFILLILGLGYLAFQYLETLMVKDYKEGRWTPSGEATDDVDHVDLAVERAANRASREVGDEAARAEAQPAIPAGGTGEGAAASPGLVPA